MHYQRWTDKEYEYLKNNYKTKTNKELAKELNRTEGAIRQKLSIKGLRQKDTKDWTTKELNYLKTNYKDKTIRELAKELGRTYASVNGMVRVCNIQAKRERQEYALYKGERILSTGTATEIANQLDVKPITIYQYGTPSYQSKAKGDNVRKLIKLDA